MKRKFYAFYSFGISVLITLCIWYVTYMMSIEHQKFNEADYKDAWFVIMVLVIIWLFSLLFLYSYMQKPIHKPNDIVPNYPEREISPEEADMLELGMEYDERLQHPIDVEDEYTDDGNWPDEAEPTKVIPRKTHKVEPDETRRIWADPML